ncbi:Cof-type HAD-IIB family hydrolase [Holzapfeliella sp. He02]|uniref:Cof-type HAD-IIB family hydrolase n=1 Tax=Holzapfeliella saturejae TaxID=3082953 RepID=A0ABU8SFS2_9LACO
MIKLIASDMDGTLLNDKLELSQENARIIKKAQDKGVEFIVATGRSLTEARPLVEGAGLKASYVTLNGAMVFDPDGNVAVEIPLEKERTQDLMTLLNEHGFYFELVTNKGLVSNSRVGRIKNVADLIVSLNPGTDFKTGIELASARAELMDILYVDDYNKILNDDSFKVMKIVVFDENGPDVFKDLRQTLDQKDDLIITSSSPNNVEINHKDAQKGIALARYAEEKNIDIADVMAIGDNYNDESMIRTAGLPVAMENAVPEIKELSKYITDTNKNNGVAKAIEHFIDLD